MKSKYLDSVFIVTQSGPSRDMLFSLPLTFWHVLPACCILRLWFLVLCILYMNFIEELNLSV